VSEEHLALVGLGGFLEDSHESGRFIGLASEQEDSGLLLAEDGLDLILRELEDGGNHKRLHPVDELILVAGTDIRHNLILEGAEENNARGGSTVLGGAVRVLSVDEDDLVLGVSEANEGIGEEALGLRAEVGEEELALGNLLLEGIAGDLGGRRAGLLQNPADDGVLGAATSVLLLFAIPKIQSDNQFDTYQAKYNSQPQFGRLE
jgi:hypothetical protein